MSRINFKLTWVEHEKSFITSGPGTGKSEPKFGPQNRNGKKLKLQIVKIQREHGQLSEQLFPKRWPLSNLNLTKNVIWTNIRWKVTETLTPKTAIDNHNKTTALKWSVKPEYQTNNNNKCKINQFESLFCLICCFTSTVNSWSNHYESMIDPLMFLDQNLSIPSRTRGKTTGWYYVATKICHILSP